MLRDASLMGMELGSLVRSFNFKICLGHRLGGIGFLQMILDAGEKGIGENEIGFVCFLLLQMECVVDDGVES